MLTLKMNSFSPFYGALMWKYLNFSVACQKYFLAFHEKLCLLDYYKNCQKYISTRCFVIFIFQTIIFF